MKTGLGESVTQMFEEDRISMAQPVLLIIGPGDTLQKITWSRGQTQGKENDIACKQCETTQTSKATGSSHPGHSKQIITLFLSKYDLNEPNRDNYYGALSFLQVPVLVAPAESNMSDFPRKACALGITCYRSRRKFLTPQQSTSKSSLV